MTNHPLYQHFVLIHRGQLLTPGFILFTGMQLGAPSKRYIGDKSVVFPVTAGAFRQPDLMHQMLALGHCGTELQQVLDKLRGTIPNNRLYKLQTLLAALFKETIEIFNRRVDGKTGDLTYVSVGGSDPTIQSWTASTLEIRDEVCLNKIGYTDSMYTLNWDTDTLIENSNTITDRPDEFITACRHLWPDHSQLKEKLGCVFSLGEASWVSPGDCKKWIEEKKQQYANPWELLLSRMLKARIIDDRHDMDKVLNLTIGAKSCDVFRSYVNENSLK